MKLVLDTNVLIAAFASRGYCFELLEHTARQHDLFTSAFILNEFRAKLTGKFRIPAATVESSIELQCSRMRVVEPRALTAPVCRDPDDDQILATALAAHADALITGDSDLLDLIEFEGIPIRSPADFWVLEAKFKPPS
ncbi:MAG TPA: putative toxin-antitoxin system toxin component, PIN family [Rhodothermales bacterium]|nr:putative toxin-antitoxin system toxin component, PIN family [Rhodothermales bacterium]